jgi:hypothetical protein
MEAHQLVAEPVRVMWITPPDLTTWVRARRPVAPRDVDDPGLTEAAADGETPHAAASHTPEPRPGMTSLVTARTAAFRRTH